jgi:hypothetical protein
VQRAELGRQDLTRQEVLLDEIAEHAADAVLLGRDDRGVRDRQAQRPAEQCGDGEPVGETAHERRFRRGPDEAKPRIDGLEGARGEKDEKRNDQEARRHALHLHELRPSGRLVHHRHGCRGRLARNAVRLKM